MGCVEIAAALIIFLAYRWLIHSTRNYTCLIHISTCNMYEARVAFLMRGFGYLAAGCSA